MTKLNYQESSILKQIIRENDPLDSHRKGYLSFLDTLDLKMNSEFERLKGLQTKEETSGQVEIQVKDFSVEVEFTQEVEEFVKKNLKSSPVVTLLEKFPGLVEEVKSK